MLLPCPWAENTKTSSTVFYELKACYVEFQKQKKDGRFRKLLKEIEKYAKEVILEPVASSDSKS